MTPPPAVSDAEVEAVIARCKEAVDYVGLDQIDVFVESADTLRALLRDRQTAEASIANLNVKADGLHRRLDECKRALHEAEARSAAGVTRCKNCGGTSLRWDFTSKNVSPVQQSRLTTTDGQSEFFLGCDDCSETLQVLSSSGVVDWLQASIPTPPAGGADDAG